MPASPSSRPPHTAAEPTQVGLRRTDFHAAIRRNERNTVWLCLIMVVIGGSLGYVIGWVLEVYLSPTGLALERGLTGSSPWGQIGAFAMLGIGAIWIMIALSVGDRILLSLAGAREVTAEEETVLHNVVEEMALAAGLPKPRVAVLESPAHI